MASSLNISFFLWWPFAWWISKMVLTLSESISGFFASICAYFSFSSVGENFVLMVKEPVISKFLVQHLFVCFSFFSCKIWTVIPVLPASHNCCKNYMICNVRKITMNYFKGGGRERRWKIESWIIAVIQSVSTVCSNQDAWYHLFLSFSYI